MDILVASNNLNKIREIKEILKDYSIYSLKEKNINIDVVENKETFEENAFKKAKEIYNIVKMPVIADDSGFCVNDLGGFPGVLSNRFLGEGKTDSQRNLDLINRCSNLTDRSAKFVTVIVYYDGTSKIVGYGEICGTVSLEERGENGFSYDRILELENNLTVAELSSSEKMR